MSFSIGAPAGAGTPLGPTAPTGFSFSGFSAPPPQSSAPTTTTTPPTTATTANALGGWGSVAPAPAQTARPTGFSFASSSTPATSTAGGGSQGTSGFGAPNQQPAGGPHTTPPAPTLQVPEYASLFHGEQWKKLKACALQTLQSGDRFDGEALQATVQEAAPLFATTLAPPHPIPADLNLRQRLASHPEVALGDRTATLTESMYREVLQLADELGVSEGTALCLYAQAAATSAASSTSSLSDSSGVVSDRHSPVEHRVQSARELWLAEQRWPFETLILLVQCRLESPWVVRATDPLLQNALVPTLLNAIREYTSAIHPLLQDLTRRETLELSQTPPSGGSNPVHLRLQLAVWQRQMLAHALFFLAYHTQWDAVEVAALLDLIRDLTNDLPVLDPYRDVPSPYDNDARGDPTTSFTAAPASAWINPLPWSVAPASQGLALQEKDELQWQRDLVETTHQTGLPDLLKCAAVLVMTAVGTLDAHSELVDRRTHKVQTFGVVRPIHRRCHAISMCNV